MKENVSTWIRLCSGVVQRGRGICVLAFILAILSGSLQPPSAHATTQPLTISSNGRYFLEGSTPFFWLGDTAWMLFSNLSLAGSPNSEVDQYLLDRKNRGFTVIQAYLVNWTTMLPNRQGHVPFFNNNIGQPNPAYFDDVETIIDKAAALGLYLALGPAELGSSMAYYDDGPAHIYGSYLAFRFRFKTNILWMLGGDRDPNTALSPVRAMALGLRTSLPNHLITCHPPGLASSRQLIPGEPWLDFSMVQVGPQSVDTYPLIRADYNLTPAKPTGNGEPWYEGHLGAGPYEMRRSAYWTFFGGGSYYTYGNVFIYNFDPGWINNLGDPGTVQLASYYRGLLAARQWWKYVPDQAVLASGAGSGITLNAAVRSTDGDSVLVYLSRSASNVTVHMSFVNVSTVRATWYNPASGQYTVIGDYPNNGTRAFSTPAGWQDAVLVLEPPGEGIPSSLSATPTSVSPGGTVTVTWTGVSGAAVADWIGRYSVGAGDSSYGDWKFASSCTQSAGGSGMPSGSCTFAMPSVSGQYEFRLFTNGTFNRIATSNTVTVSGGGASTISASPASATPGQPVTVSWTGVSSVTDWVGLYSAGSGDSSSVDWKYTSSCTFAAGGFVVSSGSCTFTMPGTPGPYEFRLFANNTLTRLAVSNTVTVSGGGAPTISASPASATPGQPVTVSWSGVSSVTDWVGLHSAGSGDSSGVDWKYTSSCTFAAGGSVVASGSCTSRCPAHPARTNSVCLRTTP